MSSIAANSAAGGTIRHMIHVSVVRPRPISIVRNNTVVTVVIVSGVDMAVCAVAVVAVFVGIFV